MSRKAKIALAGCGNIFRILHNSVFQAMSDKVEIVAIADRDVERAEQTAQPFGAQSFADVEEMLDKVKDVDILYILTYLANHHTVAHIAIDHGINFFVEKPFAATPKLCGDVISRAKKAGVHFEIGENFPFFPNDQVVYKIIREGLIGDVKKVFLMDPINFFGVHIAIHRVSQFRLCAGADVTKVRGMAFDAHNIPGPPPGIPAERAAGDPGGGKVLFAEADFADGAFGRLVCAPVWPWKDPQESPFVRCREVIGTNGTVGDHLWPNNHGQLKDSNVYLEIGPEGNRKPVPITRETKTIGGKEVLQRIVVGTDTPLIWENPFKDRPLDDWGITGATELMSLVDAVLDGKEPIYGEQAKTDLELFFAMLESDHLGGGTVALPLKEDTYIEQMVTRDLSGH